MRMQTLRCFRPVLIGGCVCLAAATAMAQSPALTTQTEAITVTAPYIVEKKVVDKAIGKRPALSVVSISQNVSYIDLDLAKPADAQKLIERVKATAVDVCKSLDKHFPPAQYIPVPAKQDCVGAATSESLIVANRLITASSAP